MYSLTCHCDLKDDYIQDAIDHTLRWIPQVTNQYEEPKFYEAFQDINNQNMITYFMTFSNKQEEQRIASMKEPREFGEKLYKMCTKEPKWTEHNLVNSIRNSKSDSQIHTRVEYKVHKDRVQDVKNKIAQFIDVVKNNEPDVRVYESYQNGEDNSKFIHLAEFKDRKSEQYHKDAKHTKEFVEFLYPNCEEIPKFIYMKLTGSVRR